MRLLRTAVVVTLAAAIAVLGCGGSSTPDAKSSAASDCDALAKQAREEVGRAIEAHKACTTNADCVEVSLSTSCFDSCSRGLAKAGASDVDAAKASAEKNACVAFKEKGCRVVIPPCAPPALRCEKGSCES